MKKHLLFAICALCIGSSYAQDFVKGGNYVTVGYGLDPWGHRGLGAGNAWGTYKKSTIGPIVATYERGITDVLGIGRIGVGGGVGQTFYTEKYNWNIGGVEDVYRTSRLSISVRGTYHFEFDVPKMDVYAGVGGGLYIFTDTDKEYNAITASYATTKKSRLGGGYHVFAGIRYYFTPVFGVFAEAGHGHRALSGGMVFAF